MNWVGESGLVLPPKVGELRMILSPYGRGVGVVAAVVSQPLKQTFSRHTVEESGSMG